MSSFFCATQVLWKREIVRFLRQRSRLIGAFATPLMFWLFIGGGLQNSFKNPSGGGQGYFEFFYPGAILLSVLFTAIFSTISVIEDRHQGFLQGVLVSPAPRSSLVFSKVLGGATLGVFQGLILLGLAPFVGTPLGFVQVIQILLLLFWMASCLTLLGFVFAWKIDSVQGYHSMMNLVLFPMWLLSGAVFPLEGAHPVFQWLGLVNPLSYGIKSMRQLMALAPDASSLASSLTMLLVLSAVLFGISLRLVCSSKES